MAFCRSCGAEVEWSETERGKRMPLDVGERSDGNLVVDHRRPSERGMVPVVRYVTAGTGNRVSHFATCPDAPEHRQKPG